MSRRAREFPVFRNVQIFCLSRNLREHQGRDLFDSHIFVSVRQTQISAHNVSKTTGVGCATDLMELTPSFL